MCSLQAEKKKEELKLMISTGVLRDTRIISCEKTCTNTMEINAGFETKNRLEVECNIFAKTVERHGFCMKQSSEKTDFTD
jgi:hypothetical protein